MAPTVALPQGLAILVASEEEAAASLDAEVVDGEAI